MTTGPTQQAVSTVNVYASMLGHLVLKDIANGSKGERMLPEALEWVSAKIQINAGEDMRERHPNPLLVKM